MVTQNEKYLSFGGIALNQVMNPEIILYYLDHCTCPVCLKIVRNPVECEKCDSCFCKDCYESLKLLKIKEECNSEPVKANKFLREILSKLKIICSFCSKDNIEYDNFSKHLKECSSTSKNHAFRDEFIKVIKEKVDLISQLEQQVIKASKGDGINEKSFFSNMTDKEIRDKVITFNLTPTEKLELYNATIEGNLSKFSQLVKDKNFPMFEEVSAKGYFWTPIHYAMHYGKFEIINFILNNADKMGILNYVIRCKSDDNRCPLMCLVRSNSIKVLQEKNELIEKIIGAFPNLYISQQVINECKARKISDTVLNKLIVMSENYNKKTLNKFYPSQDIYAGLNDAQVREKVITFGLNAEQKMALYTATIEGNVNKLKQLVIDQKYPLFEEVSAKSYYWTVLHYAMHYGKYDIVRFILNYASEKNMLGLVMRCKSNDNRCPILCLIRSSSITGEAKQEILDKVFTEFKGFSVSAEVIREGKNKGLEKVFIKHKII